MVVKTIYKIIRLATPETLSALVSAVYGIHFVRTASSISGTSFSAIQIYLDLFGLMIVLNQLTGTGAVAILSQAFGANNFSYAKKVLGHTLGLKVIVSLISVIFCLLFISPFLSYYQVDAETAKECKDYLRIMVWGFPLFFCGFTLFTAMRSVGDTKTPMWISIITLGVNYFLDKIFALGMLTGKPYNLEGLAFSYVCSQLVLIVLSFVAIKKISFPFSFTIRDLIPSDRKIIKKLLNLGLPSCAGNICKNLAEALLSRYIYLAGRDYHSAYSMIKRLIQFIVSPIVKGIGVSARVIVGQSIGAKAFSRAIHSVIRCQMIASGMVFLLFLLFNIRAEKILVFLRGNIVYEDPVLIASFKVLLLYISLSSMIYTLNTIFKDSFMGAGANFYTFIAQSIGKLLVRVLLFVFFVGSLNVSIAKLFVSVLFSETVGVLLFYYFFKNNKFTKIDIPQSL